MKKHLLIAVPLALLAGGCNAQGEDTANTAAPDSTPITQTESTPVAPAPTTTMSASDKPKTNSTKEAPDPKYKIISEANPQMPAELIAALDKVKVSPPPAKVVVPKKARVQLQTSDGSITVELNEAAAPLHVKSFLYLTKIGFYNNTVLHRYEPGFVIQGGDPLSKNPVLEKYFGTGGPGYQVPRERNSLKHDKLVLAAARSQDPDSAGSQFYITLAPATFLDDGDGYTVFGKVVAGGDNVLKLRAGSKLKKAVLLPATKQ